MNVFRCRMAVLREVRVLLALGSVTLVGWAACLADDPSSPAPTEDPRVASQTQQAAFVKSLVNLEPKEAPERRKSFDAILALQSAPLLDPATVEVLHKRHTSVLKSLKENLKPVSEACQAAGFLEETRKAALTLIFDEKRYPYPYGPDGNAKVNEEVAKLVEAVERSWKPVEPLLEGAPANKSLHKLLDNLNELEGYLADSGNPLEPDQSCDAACRKWLGMGLRKELESYAASRIVMDENDKIVPLKKPPAKAKTSCPLNWQEGDCIRVTNRYRVMMGRKAVYLDLLFSKAARAHSADMLARGYFDHITPEGKAPWDRAKDVGWKGSGCGENIHRGIGSGEGAFLGWRRSSGHHRNMLVEQWNVMGVGQAAGFWTLMTGTVATLPPVRE